MISKELVDPTEFQAIAQWGWIIEATLGICGYKAHSPIHPSRIKDREPRCPLNQQSSRHAQTSYPETLEICV